MAWAVSWFDGSVADRSMLAWRGVEAQHVVATMRLADTPREQELLEDLLEASKPSLPPGARGAHYLLATPFRYFPLHPSRFRPAGAKGQWYGAETVHAACAEVAYWRNRFIRDSAGLRDEVLVTQHSFFQAAVGGRAIDLTRPPWVQAQADWTHGTDYGQTQAVAAAAQDRGVQWLRYASVRAPGAACAVVFDPASLREPPGGLDATLQTWFCKATRERVMFTRRQQSYLWDF